jgi:ankyrin repeat protein
MAQMDIFDYEPIALERPAFRLLHLLRGNGPVIECILYQAFLDSTDTIPYDALSYTWGGTDKTSTITVNGKTCVITENLYSALQHLRLEDTDTILWVDAICIDQSNELERGHQVQQMCKIYSQAEEVIVWLGQATDETDLFMDSLRRLEEYSSIYEHRNWDIMQWNTIWLSVPLDPTCKPREGLDLLLKRPWFSRVWILQEIANAKKASVWCGTKSVRARTFALAPLLIGVKPERHCQAVLDIMPGRLRGQTWWSESRDLYNLLLKFSESEASDQRDKVYALLGISSDAFDTDSLRPDYTKDLQEVIRDTCLFLFGPSGVSYNTMSKLSEDLTSRNSISFLKLVERSDRRAVEHFLMRRGLEIPLSEDMIKGAVGNEENGRDIMSVLFEKRGSEVKVTEGVIKAAAANTKSGRAVISLLVHLCESNFEVTKKIANMLYTASAGGHEAVVKQLLDIGAKVNAQDAYYGNALQAASAGGHEAVVKLLLDNRAKVNARGGYYGNALQAASHRGHKVIVKQLLNNGAKVNAQGGEYGNALQAASYGGHEAVVELLLDNGAEINAWGKYYRNALQGAAYGRHEVIVKRLLNKGAFVSARGGYYSNALQVASARGHEAVVKLLLDNGAEVNAWGGEYSNALQAASYAGHGAIVKLLLDKGANI